VPCMPASFPSCKLDEQHCVLCTTALALASRCSSLSFPISPLGLVSKAGVVASARWTAAAACGGERGWQRLRPVRADGSAHVGVGPGVTARSIASALAPVVGAGGL
jgi:hypothetical protein